MSPRCGVLALLGLLVSLGWLCAQEPDNSALTNGFDPAMLAPTNDAAQSEELLDAIGSLATEPPPGDGSEMTNAPEEPSNPPDASQSSAPSYYPRPTGRESRSRWSQQRSNSIWSRYHSKSAHLSAITNNGPASLDYSAFRLIVERNIFDPNRHPNYQPDTQVVSHSRDADYFTLVGTMSYSDGTFAFFSGSSSEYQTSLKCGGAIAGYKVAAIGSDAVDLAQGTNHVHLRLGMQMRQDQDGSWYPTEAPIVYSVSSFEPASAASSNSAPVAAASAADSDVLKRMMERREKE